MEISTVWEFTFLIQKDMFSFVTNKWLHHLYNIQPVSSYQRTQTWPNQFWRANQNKEAPYENGNIILCPSPTLPNLSPNMHKCKKFEMRAHSCWEEHESCKFFIWARFFLDNSKIIVRHVWSQLDKVRFIFVNEHESACEVNSNFSSMVRSSRENS